MTDDVANRVKDILSVQLGVNIEDIDDDDRIVGDLGADSLDMVEIVMEVEEEFDIDVPDDIADKFQKVQDLIAFVAGKIE